MVRRGCAGQLWSRDVVTSTGAVGQLPRKQPHMNQLKPDFRFLEEMTWQASVPLVFSPQSPRCP